MSAPSLDPLAYRLYRTHWSVQDGILTSGVQRFESRYGRTRQQHVVYREFRNRFIGNNDPEKRYIFTPSQCIYCNPHDDFEHGNKRTEEHILPRGIGGTLLLRNAVCSICKELTHGYENRALDKLFVSLKKHADVKTRAKGFKSRIPIGLIDRENNEYRLNVPLDEHPVVITMGQFMAPGIFWDRPGDESGLGSIWSKAFRFDPAMLSAAERSSGFTEVFDALEFCQLLAKIAHSFTVAEIGSNSFDPYLTAFVKKNSTKRRFT